MKTILKPNLYAFTLLEMMVAMTLTGLLILFGHQIMQTFDKSSKNYHATMLKSLDLSRIVSQASYDFWHAVDFAGKQTGDELVLVLNDVQGLPLIYYLLGDSVLIRKEGERTDTLRGVQAREGMAGEMIISDSGRLFFQMFLLPERSIAVRK